MSKPSASERSDSVLVAESAEELFESAPCGLLSALPDGTILRANRTFFRWTGYAAEAVVGKRRLQELLTIGGRIYFETHFAPLLRMQGEVSEIQLDLKREDGSALPVLINIAQHCDSEGQPVALRITLVDVRDRKRFEAELIAERRRAEQAAEAKAEFLSLISHEIRTPMTAIIGIAGLLRRTNLDPKQLRYVGMLQNASDNLLALLNDVLDFSRLDAGKAKLAERPFDLRDLVYSTTYPFSARAEEKSLDLNVRVDPAAPAFVVGDSTRLGQVLTNLLGNAVKFTSAGKIQVELRALDASGPNARLRFEVSDTGIGIEQSRVEEIFDAFTQASEEVGRKFGGTGLGLAICQKVLALYGTRLQLRSKVEEGSTFWFDVTLPVAASGSPVEDATTSSADELRGVRVLVAEDNEVNLFILTQLLQRWGMDFDVVHDGAGAVQKIQERPYDVVLMDLRMPHMDGYEATERIRALPDERFRTLPIIAVTASTRVGLDERLSRAGFTSLLGKPFKSGELYEKLRQALAAPKDA